MMLRSIARDGRHSTRAKDASSAAMCNSPIARARGDVGSASDSDVVDGAGVVSDGGLVLDNGRASGHPQSARSGARASWVVGRGALLRESNSRASYANVPDQRRQAFTAWSRTLTHETRMASRD